MRARALFPIFMTFDRKSTGARENNLNVKFNIFIIKEKNLFCCITSQIYSSQKYIFIGILYLSATWK